ncbi:MAG: hypothetical protein MESAZ_02797 [Saezia sanguinis]
MSKNMPQNAQHPQKYVIWIPPGHLSPENNPDDNNADVHLYFEDGSHWVTTVYTYTNVRTLRRSFAATGECLHGAYFCDPSMLLIDRLTHQRISEVVSELIKNNELPSAFEYCGKEELQTVQKLFQNIS